MHGTGATACFRYTLYAMICTSSLSRSSTINVATSTVEVSFREQIKCTFSSWLFFVHGGLPASWPTHRISLTGYHWYHLSTTTKSTIYGGTLGAVFLWLYIRRPQAVSFSLWHGMFFPSYKNVYTSLGNTWQPLSLHLLLHFLCNCHMYLWPDHKWYI